MLDKEVPPLAVKLRPSLSRYDRPAFSLSELMSAEGGDFVHFAWWTIVGERIALEDFLRLVKVLSAHGKLSVLIELQRLSRSGDDIPTIEGLSQLILLERRAAVPIVGPLLARLTVLQDTSLGRAFSFFPMKRSPRWVNWTSRRIKSMLVRMGSKIRLPTHTQFRKSLGVRHAPPDQKLSPEAVDIYYQLCSAIDSVEGR